ncbi:MAG: TIR domain-containing protein [Candidatus Lokiarchaeota archaeon]|nr:TIR domain-containing protein [Candidatus Lokiarchaeota archaeon]
MGNIYVSYSRKDNDFVQKIISDLQATNYDVFYDSMITPGDSWVESLSDAIEDADVILVVLSPQYGNSQWAQKELEMSMVREDEQQAFVIPLLIEQCEPPLLLFDKQIIDFTSSYEHGLNKLLKTLSTFSATIQGDGAIAQGESAKAIGSGGVLIEGDMVSGDFAGRDIITYSVSPSEIDSLRAELRQAVELFKSKPSEIDEYEQLKTQDSDSNLACFIVMPFGDEDLNIVYEDFVKPVLEDDCGLLCERGDDVFGSNVIMDDIITSIKNSDLIVADLTGKNANVFYEVGICHALGKQALLLAQSMDDVPFDLRHRRVLLYEYSPRGCKKLEKSLKDNVLTMVSK